MTALIRAGSLLLCLWLTACGSTPQSHYYRLHTAASGGSKYTPSVGIGPIDIPQYLNRNSMVFSHGDNQLEIASFERWAEPLADGIQRVLSLNLSSRLDTQNIRPFPWAASDAPAYAVQVWILSLDTGAGNTRLVAEWRLYRPGEQTEIARRLSQFETAGAAANGDMLASSYSRLLERLASTIAEAIATDWQAREAG